jgi:hypothetical protein
VTRATRPDLVDRVVLALLGLLVAGVGAYGTARGGSVFGREAAHDPVLGPGLRRFVADHMLPFWVAVAVLALALAWLGWRWLRAQFPASKTVSHLDFDGGEGSTDGGTGGGTVLSSSAVNAAVADHLSTSEDVLWARARLLAGRPRPQVELRVGVSDDVDAGRLSDFVETEVLGHLRQALEVDEVDAHVELRLAGPPTRTVR